MITESKSIGIFIDGGYFSKINEALSDQLSLNIKIKSLFDFIRAEIARRSGLEITNCYITESHYFRGMMPIANICCFPSESLKTV